MRLDIRRIGAIKDHDQVVGNQTRVKGGQEQARTAVPGGRVRHHVWRGHLEDRRAGRSRVKANIVEKSGAWFSYDGQRIGQGRENAKTYLKENPETAAAIEKAVRQNASGVAESLMAPGDFAASE